VEQSSLYKIKFYDKDVGYENLWAEKLEDGLYNIQSIPYFIYNLSVDDIVRAQPDDNELLFVEVVKHSDHKTIRVRPKTFTLDDKEGTTLINDLEKLGCIVETLPPRVIAVDIPPHVPAGAISKYLIARSIPWEWADPS
jgi:Domain of unknown function (DUF4265)